MPAPATTIEAKRAVPGFILAPISLVDFWAFRYAQRDFTMDCDTLDATVMKMQFLTRHCACFRKPCHGEVGKGRHPQRGWIAA